MDPVSTPEGSCLASLYISDMFRRYSSSFFRSVIRCWCVVSKHVKVWKKTSYFIYKIAKQLVLQFLGIINPTELPEGSVLSTMEFARNFFEIGCQLLCLRVFSSVVNVCNKLMNSVQSDNSQEVTCLLPYWQVWQQRNTKFVVGQDRKQSAWNYHQWHKSHDA